MDWRYRVRKGSGFGGTLTTREPPTPEPGMELKIPVYSIAPAISFNASDGLCLGAVVNKAGQQVLTEI